MRPTADFVVLDPAATPLIERRPHDTNELAQHVCVLMTLGERLP